MAVLWEMGTCTTSSASAFVGWELLSPIMGRTLCATHARRICWRRASRLEQIGDQLGHQDPDTTRIYAKVDITGLRKVADVDLEGLL